MMYKYSTKKIRTDVNLLNLRKRERGVADLNNARDENNSMAL